MAFKLRLDNGPVWGPKARAPRNPRGGGGASLSGLKLVEDKHVRAPSNACLTMPEAFTAEREGTKSVNKMVSMQPVWFLPGVDDHDGAFLKKGASYSASLPTSAMEGLDEEHAEAAAVGERFKERIDRHGASNDLEKARKEKLTDSLKTIKKRQESKAALDDARDEIEKSKLHIPPKKPYESADDQMEKRSKKKHAKLSKEVGDRPDFTVEEAEKAREEFSRLASERKKNEVSFLLPHESLMSKGGLKSKAAKRAAEHGFYYTNEGVLRRKYKLPSGVSKDTFASKSALEEFLNK